MELALECRPAGEHSVLSQDGRAIKIRFLANQASPLKTKIKTLWTSIALPAQPERIRMTSAAHIGRSRQVDAAENGRRDHAKRPDGDQCLLEGR
jgi:hypothetical protein